MTTSIVSGCLACAKKKTLFLSNRNIVIATLLKNEVRDCYRAYANSLLKNEVRGAADLQRWSALTATDVDGTHRRSLLPRRFSNDRTWLNQWLDGVVTEIAGVWISSSASSELLRAAFNPDVCVRNQRNNLAKPKKQPCTTAHNNRSSPSVLEIDRRLKEVKSNQARKCTVSLVSSS